MLAKIIKAVLEWLSGFIKSEIKQDIKASDAETPKEVVDDFRSTIRRKLDSRKLRDNESSVHKGDDGRDTDRPRHEG
jgi:hypothetical protein